LAAASAAADTIDSKTSATGPNMPPSYRISGMEENTDFR
jgi:hypothetical protein